jgi:hypothetical protein
MKAIKTQANIGSIRSRVDRSISFNVQTPELTSEEKALFFELQGINVDLTIIPEETPEDTYSVNRELNTKTPSQRLRSVLFVLFKQKQTATSFEQFYESEMEQFIQIVKEQLDD